MFLVSSVRARVAATAVVATLAAPALLAAQSRPEITPFIASYYGLTNLASGSGGPLAGGDFDFGQTNSIAFGARIGFPIGRQLGLEAEFVYNATGVRFTEQDGLGPGIDGGFSADGNMLMGSIRAVYQPRRSNLLLFVGPAVVKRGGDAWEGDDSSDITDFGGVVGIGVRANVTPRFRLNVTAETYLYSFNNGGSDSEFQADLLVGIGVPIQLGK